MSTDFIYTDGGSVSLLRQVTDQAYRPESYWPESRSPEQLLANIKGKVRRDMARKILAEEGFTGLNAFIASEEIQGDDLRMWGRIHPAMMGGEYLPGFGAGEVEIARISLASTTGDQISIRARREQGTIRYSVVDEYDSVIRLPFESSEVPVTLGELIRLIDEAEYDEDMFSGGLVLSHMNANFDATGELDELEGFVSIESAYYPGLVDHYGDVLDRWFAERRVVDELEEDEE